MGAPGDSNPGSPKGNTVLQTGAASRIRLAPKTCWCWRRDSNSHARRHWFLRPAWLPLHHSSMEHRSGLEPDRAGLQSAASTTSAFGATTHFGGREGNRTPVEA